MDKLSRKRAIVSRVAALWKELWDRFTGTVGPNGGLSDQRPRAEGDVGEEIDTDRDEIAQAIRIGQENLEILRLAGDWCLNIGHTRGPFGVGLIEEQSGLPISGGSLRCDFAKAPSIFGMQLKETAVDFYEENCIGCGDRVATAAHEHLGTWADSQIAERKRLNAEAAQEHQQAIEACKSRAANRRFLLGQAEPATQSILDLLDRVDSVDRDEEAEDLLVKHAEMAPSDFSDPLVEHMSAEALAIANSGFLDAVFAIFERQERPSAGYAVDMAFRAIGENIGTGGAGRIISTHAQDFDVTEESLRGIVSLAAGRPDPMQGRRVDSQPAALLRFYDCDPERATGLLCDLLDDADVWTRADTGHATQMIISARPPLRPLLLPSLLDSLRHPDSSKHLGDPFAASQIASVVGELFVSDPEITDEALSKRIQSADPTLARKLWDCYESACRRRFRDEVPQEAIDTIIRRSLLFLESDLDAVLNRDIADNLSHICGAHGLDAAWLVRNLVRLLTRWAQKLREMDAREPNSEDLSVESYFAFEGERVLYTTILNCLQTALKDGAKASPAAYLKAIESQWDSADIKVARIWLLNVLQEVVQDQTTLDLALPLLRRSLSGSSPSERGAALRVLGAIRSPAVLVPEDVTARVLEAIDDKHLVVMTAAIRATRSIAIPAERGLLIIPRMLVFTAAYGTNALYADDVGRAIRLALRLAKGQENEEIIQRLFLEELSKLPSGEAAKHLCRLDLEDHTYWCRTALSALRIDSRPQYQGIGDMDRETILRKLSARPTPEIAPYFSDLSEVALERLPYKQWWSSAVADLYVLHQRHDLAATLADEMVEQYPETYEQRPMRARARLIALGHRANAAIAKGDRDSQSQILSDWADLVSERRVDEQD